jgi:aminoglycoside phosphotransferase family enzyme/predicted kinase
VTASLEFKLARDRVQALLEPGALGVAGESELVETHISWVILSGSHAYKIKKPVNFGFLDFSTLAARERFCREEIRLNRRLAPDLYLDVVSITESGSGPQLNGNGQVLEYAVRMRRFDQSAQLDKQLEARLVTPEDLRTFARRLAAFHERAAVARGKLFENLSDQTHSAAIDNIETILRSHNLSDEQRSLVNQLAVWTEQRFRALEPRLQLRAKMGKVRECHGDLHLSNLVRLADGSVTAFDCIEFSNELRWIDVLNDASFLVMDLMERNRPDLAHGFLSAYLERSGDYQDLAALRFFLVYRSLVRAKVALLTSDMPGVSATDLAIASGRCQSHLALALKLSKPGLPCLILMRGYAGSGKSWISERLAMYLPGIRMRSDLERKRIFGVPRFAATMSGIDQGIYAADASNQTYKLLLDNARSMLESGFNVIVDASFLDQAKRKAFHEMADGLGVDHLVLDVKAPMPVLRHRIARRQAEGGDPSEASLEVLEKQVNTHEEIPESELPCVMGVTSRHDLDVDLLASSIKKRLRKYPRDRAPSST